MNANNYQREMRGALATFMAKYFNGTNHLFGSETIAFPDADILQDRPQFGAQLPKPAIYVDLGIEPRPVDRRVTGAGTRRREDIPLRIAVFTSDVRRQWPDNDRIQELLGTIFDGAAGEIAASGLKVMQVGGSSKLHLDASQQWQVSQRVVTVRVVLDYGRAS